MPSKLLKPNTSKTELMNVSPKQDLFQGLSLNLPRGSNPDTYLSFSSPQMHFIIESW